MKNKKQVHRLRSLPFFVQISGTPAKKGQAGLQIVGDRREMHALVGLPNAQGVYLAQPYKLCQRAEHRLYGTLPFALHVLALFAVHPSDVAFIFCAVKRHGELLLPGTLAQTSIAYRTTRADMLPCPIFLLPGLGAVVQKLLGKRYYLALWTNVMVFFPIVCKTIGAALVGAMGRDKAP